MLSCFLGTDITKYGSTNLACMCIVPSLIDVYMGAMASRNHLRQFNLVGSNKVARFKAAF